MSDNLEHLLRHDTETKDDFWELTSQQSDRLEFKGVAVIWGCLMFVIGVGFLAPSISRGSFDFLGGLGLFALGTGVLAFFTRSRAVLDRRAGTLEYRRIGPLSPGRLVIPLKVFSEVRLAREKIKSETGGEGYSLVTVDLVTDEGKAFRLGANRDVSSDQEVSMRRRAELLAAFLQVKLRDRSSGEDVVFSPGEIQKNLAQRLDHTPPELAPPDWSALEITEESILLPAEGWTLLNRHLRRLAFGAPVASGLLLGSAAFAIQSGHNESFLWAFAAVSALLFMGSFGFLKSTLARAHKQDELCFERDFLLLRSIWQGDRTTIGRVRYDEVTEVRRLEREGGGWSDRELPIRIIAATEILTFGNGLARSDSDWLMQELQRRIVLRTEKQN